MPICPDCKSSELVQSADPEYMTCTVCKALFKLRNVQKFQDEVQLWKDRFETAVKKGADLEGRLEVIRKHYENRRETLDYPTAWMSRLGVLLSKASTLNHDATQSHSLLSKGPDHSNIANVATTNEKQAKPTLAEKRGRSNIQT